MEFFRSEIHFKTGWRLKWSPKTKHSSKCFNRNIYFRKSWKEFRCFNISHDFCHFDLQFLWKELIWITSEVECWMLNAVLTMTESESFAQNRVVCIVKIECFIKTLFWTEQLVRIQRLNQLTSFKWNKFISVNFARSNGFSLGRCIHWDKLWDLVHKVK